MLGHAPQGARVATKDSAGRSSLSFAILRSNIALTLALITDICGLAGNTSTEIAQAMSHREVIERTALHC